MIRSPSQCPGTARSSTRAGTLADHHFGRDVSPGGLSRPGPWDPQRPSGAQARDQLPLQRCAALHVEGLVERLVADPHGLIIAEVDPKAIRDLLWAPSLPTGDPHGVACCGPSTPALADRQLGRLGPEPLPRADRPRRRAAAHSQPAWRPWVAGHDARRATERSTPCTRGATFSPTRCGAVPARSSMGSGPADERSRAHRDLAPGTARSIRAQRMTGSGPTPSGTDQGSHRQRDGTTETQPATTRPPLLPRHQSSPRERSPPRTAPDPRATPPSADPATGSAPDTAEPPAAAPASSPTHTSTIKALRRPLEPGQFTSWAFTPRAIDSGLLPSMGSVGDCFDNAMIESFWSRMQVELLDRKRWHTRIELANAIFEYLEIWHNRQRRHTLLGMLTPIEFETRHQHKPAA